MEQWQIESPGESPGLLHNVSELSPPLRTEPVIHVLLGLVLCVPVALLDSAFKLVTLAVDHVKVVVRELPPTSP